MADTKISALPAVSNIASADVLAIVTGGVTKKVSRANFLLANSNISPTVANVTATAGYRYFADISGLTADRNFILPSCVSGDEIEIKITTGDDTYELVIIGDAGVSIEGGSAATEWSRLFIDGETVRFIADASDSWRVIEDGRVSCVGELFRSTNETTNTAATWTVPDFDTASIDIGDICDLTNDGFLIRRTGYYEICALYTPYGNPNDDDYLYVSFWRDASFPVTPGAGTRINYAKNRQSGAGPGVSVSMPGRKFQLTAGQVVTIQYFTESANMGWSNNNNGEAWVSIKEV